MESLPGRGEAVIAAKVGSHHINSYRLRIGCQVIHEGRQAMTFGNINKYEEEEDFGGQRN